MIDTAAQQIIDAGQWIDAQCWCPATGGNFSVRSGPERALITASGCHKGHLMPEQLLQVDLDGQPQASLLKPSAETLLHTRLYQLDNRIGAVLHTHSVASTVLSRLESGQWLTISGYEMQKSLSGNHTHDASIRIAILDNAQDMQALAAELSQRWQPEALQWGFWFADMVSTPGVTT